MQRNASPLRLSLTLLLLAGLFFGAAGQSLARGEVAPVALATTCLGNTIAQWTFTGYSSTPPLPTPPISSSSGDGQLSWSGVTFASTPFPTDVANPPAISFKGWDTSALVSNRYVEFSITTVGRSSIGLTFTSNRSDTGPTDFQLQYSIDEVTFNPIDSRKIQTSELYYIYDFSSLSDLNNKTTATFRLFGYGATSSSGNWRLDNVTFTGTCDTPGATYTPTFTATASPVRSVIISEVAWMGTLASPNHEWIELFNKSSVPIDLTGWTLSAADGSPTINLECANPIDCTINANDYFLLRNANVFSDVTTPSYSYSGSLSDNGEALTLKDTRGDIIDTANGNGGGWPAGTLTTTFDHGTMERFGTSADSDARWYTSTDNWTKHDIAGNLIHGTPGGGNSNTPTPTNTVSPTSTLSPTPTSTTTPPKTVTITEVAWMGTQASSSDEWIELYNNTNVPIDLTNWRIKRAADPAHDIIINNCEPINPNCIIAPHSYFLLERTDDNAISDIAADIFFSYEIGNSNEILSLYDSLGNKVDTANNNGGAWPAGNSITFGSMERAGAQLNDVDTSWFTHTGADPKWGEDDDGNPIKGTPKHDNWAFGVTATATATRTPTPTGTPPPAHVPFKSVVISEVGWMGTSSSYPSDEWIELFNNTMDPVDLNGWRLQSFRWNGTQFVKNLDIALTGILQPRGSEAQGDTSGYYLLETRANAVNFPGGNDPQGQTYSGSLYNTGEFLLLCSRHNIEVANNCYFNTKNQAVDFVNGSLNTNGTIKPWAAGSSTIYGSMERKNLLSDEETAYFTHTGHNPRSGQDAGGNAIKGTPGHPNWAFTVTSTPRITPTLTPTRTPTPRPAAAPILVLNEILARAGSDWNNDGKVDVYDEFIEVINYGTIDLNLSSYRLDDYELDASGKVIANAFPLPSQTLKPGEKAVFYASQTGIRLDDSGDTVRLIRASNNEVVDARSYSLVKALDFSICRYRDGFVSWVMGCFPTPGLPNKLTGALPASASNGQPLHVCVLADSVPIEFVLAECGESGLGIWNPFYWDSFPGEGGEIWQSDERDKWIVIYQ